MRIWWTIALSCQDQPLQSTLFSWCRYKHLVAIHEWMNCVAKRSAKLIRWKTVKISEWMLRVSVTASFLSVISEEKKKYRKIPFSEIFCLNARQFFSTSYLSPSPIWLHFQITACINSFFFFYLQCFRLNPVIIISFLDTIITF